jgi:hypothetical protein
MYDIATENRFWSKVETGNKEECWECVAMGLTYNGYGEIRVNGKKIYAHRFSYQLHHNRLIQDNMCICHKCDNRKCVNPNHLFLGTIKDNNIDKMNKGRGVTPKGEKHGRVKLNEIKVKEIRAKYEKGQLTKKQLANDYGVCYDTICRIIRREIWKHI